MLLQNNIKRALVYKKYHYFKSMGKPAKEKKKNNIEVELRGLLTKNEYESLLKRLDRKKIPHEDDDKNTYFFNVPKGIFKLCDEISKNRGKISLKLGAEETGALDEREIIINRRQIKEFIDLFGMLGYTKYHLVPQKRINFFLPSAELSIKYTPNFKYHFELEGKPISDRRKIEKEKKRLKKICADYGLTPLTPEEIATQVKKVKKKIGFEK
jgi:hypothetical protein